jgi:hypothetical protein
MILAVTLDGADAAYDEKGAEHHTMCERVRSGEGLQIDPPAFWRGGASKRHGLLAAN